jgi:ABC-2 type transport system ATP-binding protein
MTAVIETFGLTKTYGSAVGIEALDLTVQEGEVFGYLGPNGAGKTTTIRALLDLQRPTRGTARVLGLDSHRDSVAIHRRVGYLPGDLQLFPRMTGHEHIQWFARARRGAFDRQVRSLVERFDVTLDRPARDLSKGNRQKLGIVLAFMHAPELLILDEPTSGLDPLRQEEFAKLLRETVAEGRTVFLSSHELDEVQRVADGVAIIKEGRVVVTDTVEGLRRAAPRTMELEFASPIDASLFAAIDGVRVLAAEGPRVRLEVAGAMGPLLRLAAEHEPVDLISRRADLEELFLSYYRDRVTPEPLRAH